MKAYKKLVMAGIVAALWVAVPGTAGATHCPPDQTYPCVHGTEVTRPPDTPTPPRQVQGTQGARSAAVDADAADATDGTDGTGTGGGLPVTGGDVVGLTAMGLGALAVGSVLVRRSRRTTT